MTKEKKETKSDEALVKVEMTEKEKEEFVAFKAAQTEKTEAEEAKANEPKVPVRLEFGHQRNGHSYAPGNYVLPEGLAASLKVADDAAYRAKIATLTDDKHMIEIVGRGMSKVTHTRGSN